MPLEYNMKSGCSWAKYFTCYDMEKDRGVRISDQMSEINGGNHLNGTTL